MFYTDFSNTRLRINSGCQYETVVENCKPHFPKVAPTATHKVALMTVVRYNHIKAMTRIVVQSSSVATLTPTLALLTAGHFAEVDELRMRLGRVTGGEVGMLVALV